MRRVGILAASALLGLSAPVMAQVSVGIGIGLPSVRLGIRLGGYPVYYASGLDSNFFFYDGLYWVLSDDGWYSSSWYDGPWDFVDPAFVPLYILRVPVRYYRRPPTYFRGWDQAGPPRWGDHFGRDWEQRRSGWDRWNRAAVPARAPLPAYQREYTGGRYPRPEQQRDLQNRNYRYQPHEPVPQAQTRPQVKQPEPQRAAPPEPSRQQPAQRQKQEQRPQAQQRPAQPDPQPAREQRQQPQQRQQPEQRQQPQPRQQPEQRQPPEQRQRPEQRQQQEQKQRPEARAPQESRQPQQRPDKQADRQPERKQENAPDRKERDRDSPRDR